MSEVAVLDIEGKQTDKITVSEEIFGKFVNAAVIHQAVVMYQANLRQGTASTKERAYVSGGGKKPYRQKGTGRARAGSSRSPLWHGGGVTFGPHPRDFDYTLPKKIKSAAFKESLKAKFQEGNLICLDDLSQPINKTKEFAAILKNLNIQGKILAVFDGSDESVIKASRNIASLRIMRAQDINAYDILKNKYLLVTKTALNKLLERVQK